MLFKLCKKIYSSARRRYEAGWHAWTADRKVMLINGGFADSGDEVFRRRYEGRWEYSRRAGERFSARLRP
jgi:hypothetical protein